MEKKTVYVLRTYEDEYLKGKQKKMLKTLDAMDQDEFERHINTDLDDEQSKTDDEYESIEEAVRAYGNGSRIRFSRGYAMDVTLVEFAVIEEIIRTYDDAGEPIYDEDEYTRRQLIAPDVKEFCAWQYRNNEAYHIVKRMNASGDWDEGDCRRLCELAGKLDELEAADEDDFDSIVYDAAEYLGEDLD